MKVDAILPAGGRITGDFATEAGAEIKALIAFEGRTLLERTLDTLRATGRVQRAVVIGPGELAGHPASATADAVLPEAESGPANIMRGLEWLHHANDGRHAERVLIVTTDLPFLTPESITGFLDACPPGAAMSLPAIRKEAIEASCPHWAGTYLHLRDGAWTLGCAFLVDPQSIMANREHIERVFNARKSALAMARLLGPLFIARFMCRQLTVGHVQRRCEQILGCTGAAVLDCAPELAFDIDLPQEYRYAVQWMAQRKSEEVTKRNA